MSVLAIPLGSRLTLRLNTGLDENFKPVIRNRSWRNVKSGASNENIFTLGQEMSLLQIHTLEAVRRVDENELEEDL